MEIRKARPDDFESLYALGLATPEFQVSANEPFMESDEFEWSITNPNGVFLLAEARGKVVGFVYANAKDAERPVPRRYACIVYLVVVPSHRHQGIASALLERARQELKGMGVRQLYGWAHKAPGSPIIRFMRKHGFRKGAEYVWMDATA